MDIQKRAELQLNSKVVKKWEEINKHAADIQSLIDEEVQKLEKKCDFVPKESEEEENLESQMKVCVRTRPLLKHEQNAEYLPVVHTSNPHVLVTDPVARSARTEGAGFRLNNSIFDVDMPLALMMTMSWSTRASSIRYLKLLPREVLEPCLLMDRLVLVKHIQFLGSSQD